MLDFTIITYRRLLQALSTKGYSFQTMQDFIRHPEDSTIILRHDVDRLPSNALTCAKIESELKINASYYFRIVKGSYVEDIIRQIAEMGHEIGYHYENLSKISKRQRVMSKEELFDLAICDFERNLEKIRKFYPVKSICMHGSPLSKWDNREIWRKYNYRDFGIIAEPYFDVDFNEVLYLTDTGRRSEGEGKPRFRHTWDIIRAAESGALPDKIMITTHPQRWDDRFLPWVKELVWQNIKNVAKICIVKRKSPY